MLLLIASVAAAVSQSPSQCATIQEDAARLECYDLENRVRRSRNQTHSMWVSRTEQSRLDDSTSVYLHVRSDREHMGRAGSREHLRLHVRCVENTTAVSIYFAGAFMASGASDYVPVTYRVDDNPPRTRNFTESNNNHFLGLWNGGASIPFIRELLEGENLYIRATPFSESTIEAEFNISGLDGAIEPLREACNW